jgi:energy-coupling factor transporter transmembrane protein EcfT
MNWKEFFKPTKSKIIIALILLLVFPMFGKIESAPEIYPSKSDFGFIGTPGFYLNEQIFDLIQIAPKLSIYLALFYLMTCIIFIRRSLKK